MRFTSLTTHVASHVASQSGSARDCEVTSLLGLSSREVSFPTIELKLGELAQGLREAASRPYCEEVLSKAAFLLKLNPRQLLYSKIHSTDLDSFLSAVVKLSPVAAQGGALGGATVRLSGKMSTESGRRLRQMAEKMDLEVAQAIGEGGLLTFLGGHNIREFVSDLSRLEESAHRPEVVAVNAEIPGLSLTKLFASRVIMTCAEKLQELEDEAHSDLDQIPSDQERSIFSLVLSRPGFLFFDHLMAQSPEIREAIEPHAGCREFLYAITERAPHLRSVLERAITAASACMDQLMLVDERGHYEASSLRADSMLYPLTERIGRLILLATGSPLSGPERNRLEMVLRKRIEFDPVYGSKMSHAFSIPYPKAAGRSQRVLTIKVFPELSRNVGAPSRTQHFLLEVTAPDSGQSIEERGRSTWALASRLERLLDELERVDRFTPATSRERAAQRALLLLNETFSSFDWVCAHGRRAIEPEFALTVKAPVVVQFAQLWHGLSTIEPFLEAKGRDFFFRRIDDWIEEFSIQQGLRGDITLSDLAGAAPLLLQLGTHAELSDSDAVPSFEFVRRLYESHKGGIDLLPSGFHALLSTFPQSTRRKLVTLMGKGLVIVDPPSPAAIQVLRDHDIESVQRIFRTLSLSSGTFKPVRLSQVSLRLGSAAT